MTLKIEVTVPQEHVEGSGAAAYLANAMAAIGFQRGETASVAIGLQRGATAPAVVGNELAVEEVVAEVQETAPKRERGKPAAGRARRTKEEIAEDEAADGDAPAQANISTGEERVDPEEVAEQDAADEATEVEEHRDPANPLTIDDVKSVVGKYVARYGMAAVQEDGPKIFVEALGAPPAGQSYWKMSILPDDQAKLAHVVKVWERAVAENPMKRDVVGG